MRNLTVYFARGVSNYDRNRILPILNDRQGLSFHEVDSPEKAFLDFISPDAKNPAYSFHVRQELGHDMVHELGWTIAVPDDVQSYRLEPVLDHIFSANQEAQNGQS